MKNLKVLTTENMKKVEGGKKTHEVSVSGRYKNKDNCLSEARQIIDNGYITGMSELQIAQEIYAHTIIYYDADLARSLIGNEAVFVYLMIHANPVNLEDDGDSWKRRMAYTAIWYGYDKL